jgi:hypothetical protein
MGEGGERERDESGVRPGVECYRLACFSGENLNFTFISASIGGLNRNNRLSDLATFS